MRLNWIKNNTTEKFTLLLVLVISVWVGSNISWGKDRWKGILESDARGYYAYLPSIFIYQDLNFDFFEKIENGEYHDRHYYYDYRVKINGNSINKYWIGTSVCELPFFLSAHGITLLTGGKADGYSKLYPIFINLSGIFYAMAGLFFLTQLLQLYGISSANKNLSVVFVFFGTNLFYYAVVEPGMSHVYSFAVITLFVYLLKLFFEAPSSKMLILISILLGLIFLIRPQNMVILFIVPLAAGNKEKLKAAFNWVLSDFSLLVKVLLLFFSIGSIQLFYYKIACGTFIVDSYPGESFNFLAPHFFEIFFSFKKGLFVYTPLYLLSLFGLIFLFKKSGWDAISIVIFFILLTYLLASWHNWWYGGSFSSRVYVDYLVIFSICFSTLLQNAKKKGRLVLIFLSVLITLLCQFQIYQYRYAIIHWENMTREAYLDNFFRITTN